MSKVCVYANSQWAGDMKSQRRTHTARVHADHTVTAPSTVHIAQGFHGNAAWPRVTLCHRTWKIMKELGVWRCYDPQGILSQVKKGRSFSLDLQSSEAQVQP